ncbi:MAG: hypothetical protein R2712_26385 [Vicinamibacterales bacterium]
MVGARRHPLGARGRLRARGRLPAQNAHRYWSSYYREYMFHHLLASRGYVVLDPITGPVPATAGTGAPPSTAGWAGTT